MDSVWRRITQIGSNTVVMFMRLFVVFSLFLYDEEVGCLGRNNRYVGTRAAYVLQSDCDDMILG